MRNVSNGTCIRRLGFRSMRAARTRNFVAVLAIALTTILFTSLFTISASINYSFQQENFRQAGGDGHGTFKDLSQAQVEELRDDPLFQETWARLFVGMLHEPPFQKSHVEVSYLESAGAPHYFCAPTVGSLPQEGTDGLATDTHVLALLGIQPELGAKITLTITLDEGSMHTQTVTRTFTLSGWWEYDSAVTANHVLLPLSAAQELTALSNGERGSMTGRWDLNIMLSSDRNIRENLSAALENKGYQCSEPTAENYVRIGVNWGYTGNRFSENQDPIVLVSIGAILLLIIFTGYLIIYNVFQISVTNDIRFYGLLKTIGTTGRQIKGIIRQQALLLSLLGIPVGLALGFVIGNKLTPVIMAQLSYKNAFVSFDPWIFIGAALFSLLTVFLSCARPGRIAAKVSPVDAVRYTEGGRTSGKRRARKSGASLFQMAWANLGRSRGKTVVTVLSLALAVVLMNLVVIFANGFDMEKYLAGRVVSDFIVGHADLFQVSAGFHSKDQAVPETLLDAVSAQGGITDGGRVYGQEQVVQQHMPEEFFRQEYSRFSWYTQEDIDQLVRSTEQGGDGMLLGSAQLYGMEEFPLSKLEVLEGDLAPLSDPARNAIAAVYGTDDYQAVSWDSNWAKVGDTVTLRYVTEWKYVDLDTGEEISSEEVDARYARGESNFASWGKTFEEKEYTVCALVTLPVALSYRYLTVGGSQMILGAEQFRQDSGMNSVMSYAFDTTQESEQGMAEFLETYTQSVQPLYDFESKERQVAEFDGFRNMFLTMGGVLAGVIGLVGVLNFINAVLTGILTRKRELAVLQSVGMTGKQLKTMLVCEGLYYTMLSAGLSLLLIGLLGPLLGAVCNVFWFFTYRFTVLPVLVVTPLFLLLGALVPLAVYRRLARTTIVERLREAES